jgi:hypothetical protein
MVSFVVVQAIVPSVSDLTNARIIWSTLASPATDLVTKIVIFCVGASHISNVNSQPRNHNFVNCVFFYS